MLAPLDRAAPQRFLSAAELQATVFLNHKQAVEDAAHRLAAAAVACGYSPDEASLAAQQFARNGVADFMRSLERQLFGDCRP